MHASQVNPLLRFLGPALTLAALAAAAGALARIGHPDPGFRTAGVAAVVWNLIVPGGLAAAYLLGAIGLGRGLALLTIRPSPSQIWLGVALGLGAMLTISHALGGLGLLSGPESIVAAWAPVALGLLLLLDAIVRGELRPEGWPVFPTWVALGAPAFGLTLVAACSPPGWLWTSEARGFDALSYHLQLPKEWLESGWIRPLEHNVYSFLPSYMEAAFTHLGAMYGHGEAGRIPMIGSEGVPVLASQLLHALLGVVTALLVGRVVYMLVRTDDEATEGRARAAGCIAGATALAVPWTVVVGSLAYNELAVTALSAGALLVAFDGATGGPARRAMLAAFLLGAAASAKPTAMFLIAPCVGIVLLANMPRRAWPAAVAFGSFVGLLTLSPWLVRNWMASGNPVFPFAAEFLGHGHWIQEQVARYASAHHADAGLAERLGLLFSRERGLLHPQWSILFPAATGAFVLAFFSAYRRAAVLLAAGTLLGIAGWLAATHLQSRFLLPLLVPLAALVGLGCAALGELAMSRAGRRAVELLACAVAGLVPLSLTGASVLIFLSEGNGYPNALLTRGVTGLTGLEVRTFFEQLDEPERRERLANAATTFAVNMTLDPDRAVYLLGDSTPLYFGVPVVYHTTWDRSPLGDAIEAHPFDPAIWVESLRTRGITHVLVNAAELRRLIEKDGWYDPRVTPENLEAFFAAMGRPVAAWPERQQALYSITSEPVHAPEPTDQ